MSRSRLPTLLRPPAFLGLGLLLAVFSAATALALPGVPPINPSSPPIAPYADKAAADAHFNRYTLAPGTPFHVLLETPLSTAINHVDDPIDALLANDMYLGSEKILSRSARLKGSIVRMEEALQGRNAILEVKFNEILLENGERLPVDAHVRTEHPQHIWGGQVTEGTKPVLVTQRVAAIGEYNRIMFRGPRRMGSNVAFNPGDHWVIILDQPLTLVMPKPEETPDDAY